MNTAVSYVDVTAEADEVLFSIQGTVMELPQDFLYPFFISHASILQPAMMLFTVLFDLLIMMTSVH